MNWTADPVFIDFETQSAADIKAVGGRRYAEHPSTRVLSLALDIDETYHVWIPSRPHDTDAICHVREYAVDTRVWGGLDFPPDLQRLLAGRVLVAHNAANFDCHVWRRFIGDAPDWADTLYLARAAGYPAGLDRLATAVLAQGKDVGRKLVMSLTKAKETPDGYLYPKIQPGMVEPLIRYNLVDVLLLRKLWYGPLADAVAEGDVIDAHCAINERGVGIDLELIRSIRRIADESALHAADRLSELTGGAIHSGNFRSVQQVQKWLESKGVTIYDPATVGTGQPKRTLRKDAVEQALNHPETMLTDECPVGFAARDVIDPAVFEVLRLRTSAIRITAGKAQKAIDRVSPDGRVRDLFSYHQAHTGRWSSHGIQVHNLPRSKKGVDVERLLCLHESGRLGYDAVCEANGPGLVDDSLSALLRPAFVPAPDSVFCIADYAAIEARCVAWMAGEQGLLDVFDSGGDVYCEFASRLFGRAVTKHDKTERQIGKVCILGLGYSMGAEKFALFCAASGVDLKAVGVAPDDAVELYRSTYPKIAGTFAGRIGGNGRVYRRGGLWGDLMEAALAAVRGDGVRVAGKCTFSYADRTLFVVLPSGRKLCYRNARIEDRVPGYVYTLGLPERTKATLVYDHPQGYESALFPGKLTENLDQAICRDLLAVAVVTTEREAAVTGPVVLHVHDEEVTERPKAGMEHGLRALVRIMSTPPPWAAGFPVAVEGYCAPRYLKSAPPGWPKAEARNGVPL